MTPASPALPDAKDGMDTPTMAKIAVLGIAYPDGEKGLLTNFLLHHAIDPAIWNGNLIKIDGIPRLSAPRQSSPVMSDFRNIFHIDKEQVLPALIAAVKESLATVTNRKGEPVNMDDFAAAELERKGGDSDFTFTITPKGKDWFDAQLGTKDRIKAYFQFRKDKHTLQYLALEEAIADKVTLKALEVLDKHSVEPMSKSNAVIKIGGITSFLSKEERQNFPLVDQTSALADIKEKALKKLV